MWAVDIPIFDLNGDISFILTFYNRRISEMQKNGHEIITALKRRGFAMDEYIVSFAVVRERWL